MSPNLLGWKLCVHVMAFDICGLLSYILSIFQVSRQVDILNHLPCAVQYAILVKEERRRVKRIWFSARFISISYSFALWTEIVLSMCDAMISAYEMNRLNSFPL